MPYYLEISSWNLLESFSTESISPFSFYRERQFGNNLSRFLSGEKEKTNYLILSKKDLGGDISLVIDDEIIDSPCLMPIKGSKTAYTYPKTIYYKKGKIHIRFDNEGLRDNLIDESKILLEIKCLEKYQSDFYVKRIPSKNLKSIINLRESLSFEKEVFIHDDDKYNKIKGAFVGYIRGLYTTQDDTSIVLQNRLIDLKNTFGGLYTKVMMDETYYEKPTMYTDIADCKAQYLAVIGPSNSFDVIKAQYDEIAKITKERSKDSSTGYRRQLLKDKRQIENSLNQIEVLYNIQEVRTELKLIKEEEKSNGERKGKTREFFKKGSFEYIRKKKLEEILNDIENNEEYRQLQYELRSIEEKLNSNKYDSILSAIFTRISDILNDLIRNTSNITNNDTINLANIEMTKDSIRMKCAQDDPERIYFNILLRDIIANSSVKNLSEYHVMQLLENSATSFKKNNIVKTEKGECLLNTLRSYWAYKNQKTENYIIPDDMPILQSIMSFFIKPLDFNQIERFMRIKQYKQKCYAYMLWGASIGFADMPKTFTNILYQNENITHLMDDTLQ